MLGKDTAAAAERCINGPLCKEWVFIGFDGEDLLARGWSGALITQMSPSRDFGYRLSETRLKITCREKFIALCVPRLERKTYVRTHFTAIYRLILGSWN